MRIVLLVIVLVAAAAAHAQPIYKWTDARGVVHYGDRQPPDTKSEQLAIEPPPPASVAPTRAQQLAPRQASRPLDIVMYGRAGCGYCAKARRYFAQRGIRYTEKDVQRSAQASIEWKRLGGVGVPLFVINGEVSSGFGEASMTRRLARFDR